MDMPRCAISQVKVSKKDAKESSWQEQIEEMLSIEVFLCWASSASATLFQKGGVSFHSSRNSFKSKEKRKTLLNVWDTS